MFEYQLEHILSFNRSRRAIAGPNFSTQRRSVS